MRKLIFCAALFFMSSAIPSFAEEVQQVCKPAEASLPTCSVARSHVQELLAQIRHEEPLNYCPVPAKETKIPTS